MWKRKYDITMMTPVGARYGTMAFTVKNCEIHGILNILKKENPFSGTMDEAGNCRIRGEITTLMQRILYDAAGQISSSALYLKLTGAQDCFEISGTAVPEAEKEPAP